LYLPKENLQKGGGVLPAFLPRHKLSRVDFIVPDHLT
jgi:hypothetical protein